MNMEVFNLTSLSIFQIILAFIVAKVISKVKYTVRDYFIILGIIIPSTILYSFFGSSALIFVLLAMLIFFYFKLKFHGVLTVLLSHIVMYFTNYINLIIFITLIDKIHNTFILLLLYFIIFSAVSLFMGYLVSLLFKRLKESYLSLNKKYITIILIVLCLSFALFYFYSLTDGNEAETIKQYSLMFIGVITFLSVIILIMSMFTLREMRYKRNQEEIETYYKYTLQIEAINNEMRKFRHDYINILSTLSGYIREDDMPGLREYFNKNIIPMQDNIQMNAIKLNGIENLQVREIKGLITTKILQAQEKNVPINIEVPDEIDQVDMNTVDLSRIIGIILDNAIEASEKIDEPLIRVALMKDDNVVTFIVMNKCADDIPRIHELFQENFSTKGENRGLGLTTLKEITDSTDNTLLDTVIENGFFIQKVEIINNEA